MYDFLIDNKNSNELLSIIISEIVSILLLIYNNITKPIETYIT